MKTLLVVFHTHGVKTAQMTEALERGARAALREAQAEDEVCVMVKRCAEAGPDDLLGADALLLGTPENFGYMSGMMAQCEALGATFAAGLAIGVL